MPAKGSGPSVNAFHARDFGKREQAAASHGRIVGDTPAVSHPQRDEDSTVLGANTFKPVATGVWPLPTYLSASFPRKKP